MSRASSSIPTAPAAALLALLSAPSLGGCQTFIGIDEVQAHLPRLDGDYLIGLQRVRPSDQSTEKIRMIGLVQLDPDGRRLDLTFNILATDSGTELSENAITDLVFPDGAAEVEFDLDIDLPIGSEERPITDETDRNVAARMVLRAEGDYAFCAEQIEPLPATISIGSVVLIDDTVAPPPGAFDVDCDSL